jgi:hypothetical protein
MIILSMKTALFLYLALMLFLLFLLWGITHLRYKKKPPLPPLFHLVTCQYCLHPFLEKPSKKIVKCPVCNLLTKLNK